MASLCSNNQVRDSRFSYALRGRSSSKAQTCLHRILHIISTVPPPKPPPPCENHENPLEKRSWFDIDLNLRLGSFINGDDSEEKSESLAENSFVGQNPDGEETEEILEKIGTVTVTATMTDASSDVTEMQKSEESKSGTDGEVKKAAAFNDSLELLIEAAEMISDMDYSANEKDKELTQKSGGSMKRNKNESFVEEGFVEFEDTSPVVRSKRGRSQVLPHRFRDSVLERPQTRRSAAAVVSNRKRRSR